MKNLIFSIALALVAITGFSQEKEGFTITITVDNAKNDKGVASFALHTSETFMKGNGIMNAESAIKDGKVTITFENVKPGDYAVLALHDENKNGRMDFQDNGMPLEAYGMSNNVMSFGPPQYGDAKFTVKDEDITLNIRF